MKYVILDLETTDKIIKGFSLPDVILLAFIIADENLNIIDRKVFHSQALSKKNWSDEASEKSHGYKYEECAYWPHPDDVVKEIHLWLTDVLEGSPSHLVWHALFGFDSILFEYYYRMYFDVFAFYKIFPNKFYLNTLRMAQKTFKYKGNALDVWAKRLGIKNFKHHNPEDDVYAAYKLLRHINNNPNFMGIGHNTPNRFL